MKEETAPKTEQKIEKEEQKERTHFRFYKEFTATVFKYGTQVGVKDWSYGEFQNEYSAIIKFGNDHQVFLHSKHLKWLPDLTRIIEKIAKAREERAKIKV